MSADEAEALESQSDGFESCRITCQRCGEHSLQWNEGPPWKLLDEAGKIHVCLKNKKKANP